jgi:hypothetical protein
MLSTGSTAGIGAGKFGLFDTTASAYRWHVDTSGNFLASTDATYDFGASGANRYRDFYFSRNGVIGGTLQSGPLTVQKDWASVASTNLAAQFDSYGDVTRFTFRSANGTMASPTGKLVNEVLGNLNFRGYHSGGAFASAALGAIACLAAENFTSSAMGTTMLFLNSKIGESIGSERMRLHSNGYIGVNQTSPTSQLHTVSSSATVNAFKSEAHASSTVPAGVFVAPSGVAPINLGNLTSASSYTSSLQPLGVDSSGNVFLHEPVLTVNDLGSTLLTGPTDVNEAYAFNWTAKHIWKLGTTPQSAVQLEMTTRTTDGNTDSHYLEWISKHRSASVNATGNWRAFADSIDNSGTSNLVFRGAVDNTGYTTALTLNQSGDVTAGRAFILTQMSDASAPNGALYFSTTGSKAAVKDFSGTVNYLY